MKKTIIKIALAIGLFLFVLFIVCKVDSSRVYTITHDADGGYTINATVEVRHMQPITPEGFFPKTKSQYSITLVGEGENWNYRAQNGYYYSLDVIKSKKATLPFDVGYAWVDEKRENIYFNFYWVNSPDKLIPTELNGKYAIK